MERATHRAQPERSFSSTSVTDSSTFVITQADVGSPAVRAGIAAQLEQERTALLVAAKAVLAKVRAGRAQLGEPCETILATAIRIAEARK